MALALGGGREAQANDDFQEWTLLVLNKRLPRSNYRLYFELQPRFGEDASVLDRVLIRPAFGYNVSRTTSVWLGYAAVPAFRPRYTLEHRVFQQVLVENRYPRYDVINRSRLEERFLDGIGETAWRVRHLARGLYYLDGKRKWAAVAQNEAFWNLNTVNRGPRAGFDQNRLFIGANTAVAPYLRVEAGYQLNTVNLPAPTPDRTNHTLLVSLFFNL